MNHGMRCHRCDIRGADPNVTAVTLNGVSQQESRTRTPRQLLRFKTAKYVQKKKYIEIIKFLQIIKSD